MSEHIPTGYEHDPLSPERFLLRCPDCGHTETHRTRPMRGSQKCGSCNRLMGITPISKIHEPDERAEQQRAMADGGEDTDETEQCPICETELYSHTDAPGYLWCDDCEREYWREGEQWYRCGVDGDIQTVDAGGVPA